MTEIWKGIPGYDLYEVSNQGQVRSWHNNKWGRHNQSRILKPGTGSSGYLTVALSANGQQRTFAVHTLVLTTFAGPPPDGMECCHFDGGRTNNHLDNLRWDTRAANVQDAIRHGTAFVPVSPNLRGEAASQSRLTEGDVIEIRKLYTAGGITHDELGEEFGVARPTISDIIRRETWAHVKEAA